MQKKLGGGREWVEEVLQQGRKIVRGVIAT